MSVSFANQKEVHDTIGSILRSDVFSGWVLVGYQDDKTLVLQASGNGGVDELKGHLRSDQFQYALIRILDDSKDVKTQGPRPTTRDVFIAWQGPDVGIVRRGKLNEHRGVVESVMQPSHAQLTAVALDNFTDANVRAKSSKLSGSHVID